MTTEKHIDQKNIEIFGATRSLLVFELAKEAFPQRANGLLTRTANCLIGLRAAHACSLRFDEILSVRPVVPEALWPALENLGRRIESGEALVEFFLPEREKTIIELMAIVRLQETQRIFCIAVTAGRNSLLLQIRALSCLAFTCNGHSMKIRSPKFNRIVKDDVRFHNALALLETAGAHAKAEWQAENALDLHFFDSIPETDPELNPIIRRMIVASPVTKDAEMKESALSQKTTLRESLLTLLEHEALARTGASAFLKKNKKDEDDDGKPNAREACSFEELLAMIFRRATKRSWIRRAIGTKDPAGHDIAVERKATHVERISSWVAAHVAANKFHAAYPHAAKLAGTATLSCFFVMMLQGCTAITGLNGTDSFSCPKAPGVSCSSLHETYEMNAAGLLPHQVADASSTPTPEVHETLEAATAQEESKARPEEAAVLRRTPVASASGTTNVEVVHAKNRPIELRESEKASAGDEPQDTEPARATRALRALTRTDADSPFAASPKRSAEEIIRITIAPWTDSDGDLHEGHRLYMRVREAAWQTAHSEYGNDSARPAVAALPFALPVSHPAGAQTRTEAPATEKEPQGAETSSEALRELRDTYAEALEKVLPNGSTLR